MTSAHEPALPKPMLSFQRGYALSQRRLTWGFQRGFQACRIQVSRPGYENALARLLHITACHSRMQRNAPSRQLRCLNLCSVLRGALHNTCRSVLASCLVACRKFCVYVSQQVSRSLDDKNKTNKCSVFFEAHLQKCVKHDRQRGYNGFRHQASISFHSCQGIT